MPRAIVAMRLVLLTAILGGVLLAWVVSPTWVGEDSGSAPAPDTAVAPQTAAGMTAAPLAPLDAPLAADWTDAGLDAALPLLPPPVATAEAVVFASGGVASEALIVLTPAETANYKLVNLLELARLVNGASPDGYPVPAGSTFSFLRSGLMDGHYVPGWDNAQRLIDAGGICAGSTLVATLVGAAQDQGLPVVLTHRVSHHTYEAAYHQINEVNGRQVPVLDSAILEEPGVYQDLRWANQDTAHYAFRFFLLREAEDGTRVPLDADAVRAAYDQDPFAAIPAPVYFYGRLMRLP
jgi:hypothetical protein